MNRRGFFKIASAGAISAGSAVFGLGEPRRVPPSERIGLAVIGAGSRGQELIRYFLRLPGVEIRALCDVYEPRFAQAQKIIGQRVATYDDYRRLLDRARDVDAVVVATPLHLHAEQVIAALDSGRHVYGEKTMAYDLEQSNRIVEAVRRTGKLYQVGHQYRYAPWYREALERIRAGEIGQPTHIFGYWHRNSTWRRPVPEPKYERLINWRMYRAYSGGLMAELGSHHVDFANWLFGALPETVMGSGGIDFYKDGREVWDNIEVVFRYPGGRTFTFSSLLNNHKVGYQIWIYGSGGSVELTLEDGTFYYERNRPVPSASSEVIERGVRTGASYSVRGDMPYRGPGASIKVPETAAGNPNFMACQAFIDAARRQSRPFADERVGWASSVCVHLANKAIEQGTRLRVADYVKG